MAKIHLSRVESSAFKNLSYVGPSVNVLNCQPCVQFIFSPGCESDMILSVMTMAPNVGLTVLSKVTQTYIGFVKICKIGTKCGEKTKLARHPKDQKFQEITKYSELKNFNSQCIKVF